MIKPIRKNSDFEKALERVSALMDKKCSKQENDELDILATLIEKYEEEHYPIDFPDPVEAIKFSMERTGIDQSELSSILGGRNRASEILHRKRKLTLGMIRKLHNSLSIPTDSLIKKYSTVK
jgi:HTH-type transcriptional regulator / antitoxin HigA